MVRPARTGPAPAGIPARPHHLEEASMKFALPWFLVAAALVPLLLLGLHRWSEGRAKRKLDSVIAPRLRQALLRSVDFGKRWREAIALAAGSALLWIAVARPQF